MALARILKEHQQSRSFEVIMAHVNHKLRGAASEADERFVRQLARELGWRCQVTQCPVKPLKSGNLEEVARDKRYTALLNIALKEKSTLLFTAHTLDDQVETVLMNLLRGTGPDGLAGMPPLRRMKKSKVWLCRPLLGVSKKELVAGLRVSKVQFRQDRSNGDSSFLRNWLRLKLIPLIEKKTPDFQKRIRNLSEMALGEKQFWQGQMDEMEFHLFKRLRGGRLLDLGGLLRYSPAAQRRFLRRALGRDLLTYDAVERLREWMQSPPSGGRLWQLRQGWTVERLSKTKGSPSTKLFWFKQSKIGKDKNSHEKV